LFVFAAFAKPWRPSRSLGALCGWKLLTAKIAKKIREGHKERQGTRFSMILFNDSMIQFHLTSPPRMKAYLHRRYRFSSSHRLHSEQMSDEENRTTYGKCNNPHGHGHNYILEVMVSGQVDSNGMVCNLVDLDQCVQREIVTRFDLENLNMRPEFADSVPTTENLCTVVYDILKREFTGAHLEKVRLEETMMNSFEYNGS
jgi:6-pyruvoyltetrahydropterin/6-carboxytetrahydropterin synthase